MRIGRKNLTRLLFWLVVPAVLAWFFAALSGVNSGQREQGRSQLERTLRRAAVAEYAVNGAYPATLEQLTAGTGIQIDREHYLVFYRAFASNLMPEITVLEKEL